MTDTRRSKTDSTRTSVRYRDWVRSESIRFSLRPGELADLRTISEAWGVPVATVVWSIISERLAKWRRRAPELGPAGLAIVAAMTVTRGAVRPAPEWDGDGGAEEGP